MGGVLRDAVLLAVLLSGGTLAAIKEEPIPELKPPRGMVEIIEERRHSPLWLLLPAAGVAAGIAVLISTRRSPAPVAPPDVRALRMLGECGDAAAVARVFREYVEAALGVPGRAATVDEIAAGLAHRPGGGGPLLDRVRRFMDPVELAKFAPGMEAPPLAELKQEAAALVVQLRAMGEGAQ